ncbi:MAG: 1,4-alpha-glucan-branching enzyme [Bacteroidetes bacterium HGW-Bacteroidetes-16]|jgi:1,4-alpha-glucan branching enzyme|nr:MAG: 1,4-alpha-glucan-branching enzyme [Bacteroidetes bacterium HGW-Bacteroidetes-16]
MNKLSLVQNDPWLEPYNGVLLHRHQRTMQKILDLTEGTGKLIDFSNGHLYFGLHRTPDGWVFREWAPNATAIYLLGDFNHWKKSADYKLIALDHGVWEISLSPDTLHHGMLYKLLIEWDGGSGERIPAWCRRVVQDENTHLFSAQVWNPKKPFQWKNKLPAKVKSPLIYEAHVGMATAELKVGTYVEFTQNVLPRIAKLGYNTLQLMAIQEHPYYGSFGYQVSSFFAPSSRFGSPEELMELIDEAHGLGISVLLDVVHSHAVKNSIEGLARFDGSDYQYFHAGSKGDHPAWDSRCFNYGSDEVVHFLLSNLKYWMDEFHFDGFRFDGVTSMIYTHHGLGVDFSNYDMYFNGDQDEDALTYLSLANMLVKEINNKAITVAEDVSGMPGIASPYQDGGVGFDFRMSMGVADYWIKIIKERKDEHWLMGEMYYQLSNKRADERTISYAECHDQAMVGDKTIIFRLIDAKMYTSMQKIDEDIIIDRGLALHKMIRLISLVTAGDGYLTFMGNEFGHPEWIDFPRQGNNWSYTYARRQWNLVDNKELRYHLLSDFDSAMINLEKENHWLSQSMQPISLNDGDQVMIFSRAELLFIFNFNPSISFTDYGFVTPEGKYQVVLNTDDKKFGGFGRNNDAVIHATQQVGNQPWLLLYLPSRSAVVLKKV